MESCAQQPAAQLVFVVRLSRSTNVAMMSEPSSAVTSALCRKRFASAASALNRRLEPQLRLLQPIRRLWHQAGANVAEKMRVLSATTRTTSFAIARIMEVVVLEAWTARHRAWLELPCYTRSMHAVSRMFSTRPVHPVSAICSSHARVIGLAYAKTRMHAARRPRHQPLPLLQRRSMSTRW